LRTITAITEQKRNLDRVNIFLDGEYALSLGTEQAALLRVGTPLSEEAIHALSDEDAYRRAREAATGLLSYRPRSVSEVRRSLTQKDYDIATVERVIANLQEVGLLDDQAFANYWVDQRTAFKPRSKLALRQELAGKGLSREVIEEALEAISDEEMAQKAASQRGYRWSQLPYDEYRQKMSRYLQSRGFSYQTISQAVTASWQELDHDESTE
jgi:regulatory protein